MSKDITKYFEEFSGYLNQYDRRAATFYALDLLKTAQVTIPELYEMVLAPALNKIAVPRDQAEDLIWREHTVTNIVRGIVEGAYPYVLAEKERFPMETNPGRILLACPEEEYHELGIRMGADFFTIAHFDVVFIGSNLPLSNVLSATRNLKPDYVGISVTNYLRLVRLKQITEGLRAQLDPSIKIIVSGSAFSHTGTSAADFGADALINTFEDVVALGRSAHEARA